MLVLEVTWLEVKLFLNHGGKISTCFLKLHSTCPKEDFKKKLFLKILFFFKLFDNLNEHLLCLARKFSAGISKLKNAVFVSKDQSKNQFLKVLYFLNSSDLWTNNYRAWRKSFGRDIKIENCTLSLQSIMLRIKIIFESFVSFPFIRTWNKTFLDLWQQSFHPGCQKGILGVYMSPLRDVGIRSDMTWSETFFEPWRKNFDLFLKTAFHVSEGRF